MTKIKPLIQNFKDSYYLNPSQHPVFYELLKRLVDNASHVMGRPIPIPVVAIVAGDADDFGWFSGDNKNESGMVVGENVLKKLDRPETQFKLAHEISHGILGNGSSLREIIDSYDATIKQKLSEMPSLTGDQIELIKKQTQDMLYSESRKGECHADALAALIVNPKVSLQLVAEFDKVVKKPSDERPPTTHPLFKQRNALVEMVAKGEITISDILDGRIDDSCQLSASLPKKPVVENRDR